MGKRKYAGTPYDDVFRSLVVDHKQLLLAFINEMFSNLGERYQGDEEVINLSEIVYINRQDGEQDKRIRRLGNRCDQP